MRNVPKCLLLERNTFFRVHRCSFATQCLAITILGISFDYSCEFRVIMKQAHQNERIKFGMGSTSSHSSFQTCFFTRRKQLKARFNLLVTLLSCLSRQESRGRLRYHLMNFHIVKKRTRSLPLTNHGNQSI
jgi:hypothetical protein